MIYEIGDFVKCQNTKHKNQYSYARVVGYEKESRTYTVEDIFTTEDRKLKGTIDSTLKGDTSHIVYKVNKREVYAELI